MVSKLSSCSLERTAAARPLGTRSNTCVLLGFRSAGITSHDLGTLMRGNMKILKNILLQDDTEFTKVWTKSSKSLILYESGRLYFENYRYCYTSLTPEPQLLYKLPMRPKAEKIEDSLLCQCPIEKVLPCAVQQKPSLLVLMANNWLCQLSADTGETLCRVYLSSYIKFKSLSWDVSQETFYVKSIHSKPTSQPRQAAVSNNNILMHVAIFKVFPLGLVGLMEIDKRVFGKNVDDVLLSQGVLTVLHSSKCVKLYNFEYIVGKYRTEKLVLGQKCELNKASGIVGEASYGIPVNIQVTECPPVLFEMSFLDNGIQIGGHPWHYIYTPNHKRHRGTYHICSITDGALAKNGVQDMKSNSLEEDWIFFHPDDSGRIIHAGPDIINILKIQAEKDVESHYEVVRDFSIMASRDINASPNVMVTSSGRTVKRRFQQLDDDGAQETLIMIKYEDELDLLAVVDVNPTEDEGQATVRLHHNKSGALLNRFVLQEPWDVTFSHEVYFDRDTIIHIDQRRNNSYCCHVYKIKRKTN